MYFSIQHLLRNASNLPSVFKILLYSIFSSSFRNINENKMVKITQYLFQNSSFQINSGEEGRDGKKTFHIKQVAITKQYISKLNLFRFVRRVNKSYGDTEQGQLMCVRTKRIRQRRRRRRRAQECKVLTILCSWHFFFNDVNNNPYKSTFIVYRSRFIFVGV